jgi:hypothetical protein
MVVMADRVVADDAVVAHYVTMAHGAVIAGDGDRAVDVRGGGGRVDSGVVLGGHAVALLRERRRRDDR